jgi:predicted phosphodiesterase
MTNEDEKLSIVLGLLKQGLGRRRIAQALEITEWKARNLIEEAVELGDRQDVDTPKLPTRQKQKSKLVSSKDHSKTKKTRVSIGPAHGQSPIRHKTLKRSTSLKVAVLSDIHYPYEDTKACEIADIFLEDWEPDILVYNGDIADCYAISSYDKSPKKMNIQDEFDYTYERLQDRIERLPTVKETYCLEGNHEDRFKRLIKRNANALQALRNLRVENSLGLDELGITWIGGEEEFKIGNLLFTHGHIIRKHAGNTARGHYDQYGCSVLVGHCHRLGVGYKRNVHGNHAYIENGTLCDFDVEYTKYPDWQHGFTTIEFDGDDFVATSRPINHYKIIAEGNVYAI